MPLNFESCRKYDKYQKGCATGQDSPKPVGYSKGFKKPLQEHPFILSQWGKEELRFKRIIFLHKLLIASTWQILSKETAFLQRVYLFFLIS